MTTSKEALDFLSGGLFPTKTTPEYKIVENHLKALEIIKKKRVSVHLLFNKSFILDDEKGLEKYNMMSEKKEQLTMDEYKLLKEVLKNE